MIDERARRRTEKARKRDVRMTEASRKEQEKRRQLHVADRLPNWVDSTDQPGVLLISLSTPCNFVTYQRRSGLID